MNKFKNIVKDVLGAKLDSKWDDLMEKPKSEAGPAIFVDFLTDTGEGHAPYEECLDINALKIIVDEKLEDYNMEPGFIPMDLVIFRDALLHITRIARVIAHTRQRITNWCRW